MHFGIIDWLPLILLIFLKHQLLLVIQTWQGNPLMTYLAIIKKMKSLALILALTTNKVS